MRGRVAVPAVVFGVLLGLYASFAEACPRLPDGLRASVRPVNLAAPIPADGALVFHLNCWHDCTPCLAAAQAINIDLRDGSGRIVEGGKPEQVFLSDRALEHLVIWRPREPLVVDVPYTVQMGVVGQSDTSTSDVVVKPAEPPVAFEQLFTAKSVSYREERGTIYHCDTSRTDCDRSTFSFGDQYALLPALSIILDAAAAGQTMYRFRDTTLGNDSTWSSWSSGGESRVAVLNYRERHDSYCGEVEARRIVGTANPVVFPICAGHGSLDAPSVHTKDVAAIDGELATCPSPPAELQDRWCTLKGFPCGGDAGVSCSFGGADYCGPNARKGESATVWEDRRSPPAEGEAPCAHPSDPYALVAGGGCRIEQRISSGRGGVAALIALFASWRRGRGSRALRKRTLR